MKKFKKLISVATAVVLCLFIIPFSQAADETFSASLKIIAALSVSESSSLTFPITESSAQAQQVTIGTSDSGAASFNISGEANASITASIVENSLQMTVGNSTITINNFTFGGALSGAGSASLNTGGALTGAKVGATASIPAAAEAGNYSGALTFRVVYN